MFSAPEYESYIALCRELHLEREFEWGDWFMDVDSWSPRGPSLVYPDTWQVGDRMKTTLTETHTSRTVIWLPRLDQWLTMLEEAGVASAHWEKLDSNGWHRLYPNPTLVDWPFGEDGLMTAGSSREEAAARLWVVVTRRVVAP